MNYSTLALLLLCVSTPILAAETRPTIIADDDDSDLRQEPSPREPTSDVSDSAQPAGSRGAGRPPLTPLESEYGPSDEYPSDDDIAPAARQSGDAAAAAAPSEQNGVVFYKTLHDLNFAVVASKKNDRGEHIEDTLAHTLDYAQQEEAFRTWLDSADATRMKEAWEQILEKRRQPQTERHPAEELAHRFLEDREFQEQYDKKYPQDIDKDEEKPDGIRCYTRQPRMNEAEFDDEADTGEDDEEQDDDRSDGTGRFRGVRYDLEHEGVDDMDLLETQYPGRRGFDRARFPGIVRIGVVFVVHQLPAVTGNYVGQPEIKEIIDNMNRVYNPYGVHTFIHDVVYHNIAGYPGVVTDAGGFNVPPGGWGKMAKAQALAARINGVLGYGTQNYFHIHILNRSAAVHSKKCGAKSQFPYMVGAGGMANYGIVTKHGASLINGANANYFTLVMDEGCATHANWVFAHEAGHSFGLYHPFASVAPCPANLAPFRNAKTEMLPRAYRDWHVNQSKEFSCTNINSVTKVRHSPKTCPANQPVDYWNVMNYMLCETMSRFRDHGAVAVGTAIDSAFAAHIDDQSELVQKRLSPGQGMRVRKILQRMISNNANYIQVQWGKCAAQDYEQDCLKTEDDANLGSGESCRWTGAACVNSAVAGVNDYHRDLVPRAGGFINDDNSWDARTCNAQLTQQDCLAVQGPTLGMSCYWCKGSPGPLQAPSCSDNLPGNLARRATCRQTSLHSGCAGKQTAHECLQVESSTAGQSCFWCPGLETSQCRDALPLAPADQRTCTQKTSTGCQALTTEKGCLSASRATGSDTSCAWCPQLGAHGKCQDDVYHDCGLANIGGASSRDVSDMLDCVCKTDVGQDIRGDYTWCTNTLGLRKTMTKYCLKERVCDITRGSERTRLQKIANHIAICNTQYVDCQYYEGRHACKAHHSAGAGLGGPAPRCHWCWSLDRCEALPAPLAADSNYVHCV